jgi:hypothetical protein
MQINPTSLAGTRKKNGEVDRSSHRWQTSAKRPAIIDEGKRARRTVRTTQVQLRNLSGTEMPRDLWRSVASAMGLDGLLPQARSGEWPVYYEGRTLHVTVNRRTNRSMSEGEVVCGAYALGKIYLYPCLRCTTAFLTYTFLHELCHAWLDAFHRRLYITEEACAFCNQFADEAFRLLGGRKPREMKCWRCFLPTNIEFRNIRRFEQYAFKVTKQPGATIEHLLRESRKAAVK